MMFLVFLENEMESGSDLDESRMPFLTTIYVCICQGWVFVYFSSLLANNGDCKKKSEIITKRKNDVSRSIDVNDVCAHSII
jgi:hypothetical protein